MKPEEYAQLPFAEIAIDDWSLLNRPVGGRPLLWIEVDGKPVARLPFTGGRHEMAIGGAQSYLHLTFIAGDATMRSRPEIPPLPEPGDRDDVRTR